MEAIEKKKHESRNKIRQAVTQYNLNGEKIKSYISITEAALALNVHLLDISRALQNEGYTTAQGFLWARGNGPAVIKISAGVKRNNELKQLYTQVVSQYDKEVIRLKVYDSLLQAAKSTQSSLFLLVQIVTGKSLSHKGFYWRLGKGPAKITIGSLSKAHKNYLTKVSRPVIQYSSTGKKIKEFKSLTAAPIATNTATAQIRMAASGKYKFAKGYAWRFK